MKNVLCALLVSLLGLPLAAQQVNPSALPDLYQQSIPLELSGGLHLVDLKARCNGCSPWRELSFYSLTEPVKTERVSVSDGYNAMYAFPGTHYFANVKIERSEVGHFELDREIIGRALRHECQRKLVNVENYLATKPAVWEKFERIRMPGRPYLEVEEGTRNGIAYLACTENAIGLISSTISQVQLFVPTKRITVTAYLLNQDKAHFSTIEEFRQLRDEFLADYSIFLSNHL